jgi:hypothetical protein
MISANHKPVFRQHVKHRNSLIYRTGSEVEIFSTATELQRQCQDWYRRPIIQMAESTEQVAQVNTASDLLESSSSNSHAAEEQVWTFLNYPPRWIVNTFYVDLVLNALAMSIYISLITHPVI